MQKQTAIYTIKYEIEISPTDLNDSYKYIFCNKIIIQILQTLKRKKQFRSGSEIL